MNNRIYTCTGNIIKEWSIELTPVIAVQNSTNGTLNGTSNGTTNGTINNSDITEVPG